jgi:hypothetical protein
MQRFSSARDAAFPQQHIEHPKCVQVEIISVLSWNTRHIRPSGRYFSHAARDTLDALA